MIDEKKLIDDIHEYMEKLLDNAWGDDIDEILNLEKNIAGIIESQLKVGKWIPCSERMPEEHESIFAKMKGTNKWHSGMFESRSDDVIVTVEFDDGTRKTQASSTAEGNWLCEKDFIKKKVIAWQPMPTHYSGAVRM